jgi:homoserine dehydrogenase
MDNKKQINIGVLGLGVVGSGTVNTLIENSDTIANRLGVRLNVSKVAVRDPAKKRDVSLPAGVLTSRPEDVLDDPSIDIVCELIGGVEPARSLVERALNSGKNVVTANKEMMAKAGGDLMRLAEEKDLDFLFEGSVGGGIPVIQPLKQALAANRFEEVMGIVNGTTNYILTKMAAEGAEFADVLREAQERGYAEPDPTNDVEGYDAQYKIAILSSIVFNSRVNINDIFVEGITRLSRRDFEMADILGYVIKLVGIGQDSGDGLRVRVHPALLRKDHPLASVNDVYNAIYVRGNPVGNVMFYGRGAGPGPTGSAVVGDIMEIARNIRRGATGRLGCTCFAQRKVLPMASLQTRYFVRLTTEDRPRVLASVASVFGDFDVSIESVEQRAHEDGKAEIVLLTHRTIEHNLASSLDVLSRLPIVARIDNWLRVEE